MSPRNENENIDSNEANFCACEGCPKCFINEVSESSLLESIRDYFTPPDVLLMRTAGRFGEEDDSTTGEVSWRELVLVFSVP